MESQGAQAQAAELIADANLASRRFDVPAGGSIYEPSTPAQSLYLLHSGQVRVLLQTPGEGERAVRLLEILGPGDWFGAPALIGGRNYGTRATAVTAVTASEVPADRVFEALAQQTEIAASLIRALAGKLQTAYTEAAGLVFDDTNQRLIKTLLQFSRSAAATEQDEGVELRITHQQLAQAIGAARETVSLALTQLRQKNLLRTGRNRLSFNRDALENFYKGQSSPEIAEEAK
ncbi:Crp/Fnr family transcriptional regulator [Humisphaera borealis]|uniref:Crp/Fnr family transcriptional regulator n=1 Tax=Humisphaera borealis TaxID=2807512 RepID=A0A7M2WY25_9BACT|nr:Crp/Fnr family transcriptional regulator [Humisphaera borealis]QOV89420.1 Crp/Fnr family transcriptional regulator [Humisphaera borealis]